MKMPTLRWSLALALSLGGCNCGDDDMPMMDAGPMDGPMVSMEPPASLQVTTSPSRAVYGVGQAVRGVAVAYDAMGIELAVLPEIRWSVDPVSAASQDAPGVFVLAEEGYVTFTGCTDSPDGEICDQSRILVDAGAPMLIVDSPRPGQELSGAVDGEEIVVTGSVMDTRMTRVRVNGAVGLVEEGNFEVRVPAYFGVNHLDVVASDGLTDVAREQLDVLWAPQYALATEAGLPQVSLDPALLLQFSQVFFDDGRPLDTSADPLITRDLADVFELILNQIEFGTLLPDPVVDNAPTFLLRIPSAEMDDIAVELVLVEGGIDLFVRIGSLELQSEGALRIDRTMLNLDGTIVAELSAFAHLALSKDGPDAPVVSRIERLTVAVESAEGTFVDPEAAAVFRLATGLLRTTIETTLSSAIQEQLLSSIPAVLSDALGGIDGSLRDQSLNIDTEYTDPVELRIDGRLNGLPIVPGRHVRAPIQLSAGTASEVAFPSSLGVAMLEPQEEVLFESSPTQLAIDLVVLNGLLHTLWNSGILNLDVSAALPETTAAAVDLALLEGRLPPVIRPARPGDESDLVLALGQAEVLLEALGETTRFGLTIEAPVSIQVVDGTASIELGDEPQIRTWIIESTSDRPLIDDETLASLLETQLWPSLETSISEGLAFSLPNFEIDLSSVSPDLAGFAFGLNLRERADVRGGQLILDLALEGRSE